MNQDKIKTIIDITKEYVFSYIHRGFYVNLISIFACIEEPSRMNYVIPSQFAAFCYRSYTKYRHQND